MKSDKVIITGIIVLGVIQLAAMHYGINGTLRTTIAIAIAGIAGFAIPSPFNQK